MHTRHSCSPCTQCQTRRCFGCFTPAKCAGGLCGCSCMASRRHATTCCGVAAGAAAGAGTQRLAAAADAGSQCTCCGGLGQPLRCCAGQVTTCLLPPCLALVPWNATGPDTNALCAQNFPHSPVLFSTLSSSWCLPVHSMGSRMGSNASAGRGSVTTVSGGSGSGGGRSNTSSTTAARSHVEAEAAAKVRAAGCPVCSVSCKLHHVNSPSLWCACTRCIRSRRPKRRIIPVAH